MNANSSAPHSTGLIRMILGLMLVLALTGCARYATTDFDSNARFETYEHYRFAEREEGSVQSLDAARIERALEKELEKEGFVRAEAGASPALTVRYRIEQERRLESRGPNFGLGFGFGSNPFTFGMAHSPVESREIKEGQLVVELVDPQAEQVVWQGRAARNLTDSMTADQRQTLINRVVRAMFEQYPPE
ncbi:uncharacterized protein DUF4136 [Halospina denitrificans]|uniref:Uncharacterized protein DUF4136 n=1 Tax=Halospina denitrificans TaxID=332522 RepID=A0A4R7K163_9GAMM|nr:DUF4136 domain-containing protein [Halospina denitrificans]TDT44176.1 uncharacterized protein DUF4136 [Halospina denitrificans]